MKAVMYGGGNIGRGFVGALLSQSGYQVTFIDVAEAVVKSLQEEREYPVRYVSNAGFEEVVIKNVTAVNGNETEQAAEAIAEADIMATAVGARVLKIIVPNIVEGLRRRWARNAEPLNIIICENLMDADKVLEKMLKAQLTEEESRIFDEKVGLVEASIGRMVPVQTNEMKDGNPMRVCVERYGYLPTDKSAFKGEIPQICNMVPFEPFDFFLKRKLYIHNMGHAVCAYLGDILGLEYIYQAIDVSDVRIIVQNAMLESASALSERYGVKMSEIFCHITDLLYRFTNKALKDTCKRVGGDPGRKLSPEDRLIGASTLAMECDVVPAYISLGAAAAVFRYICETEGLEQSVMSAQKVLKDVSGLEADSVLGTMISDYYEKILAGDTLKALRSYAEEMKHKSLPDVI